MKKPRWYGQVPKKDDFGSIIEDEFIDGKMFNGTWSIMTPKSWNLYGCGKLGTGYGQRYKKNSENIFMKIEG